MGRGGCGVGGGWGRGDHRGNVGNEPEKSLPRKCLFGTSGHSEEADEEEAEVEVEVGIEITFACRGFLFYLVGPFLSLNVPRLVSSASST